MTDYTKQVGRRDTTQGEVKSQDKGIMTLVFRPSLAQFVWCGIWSDFEENKHIFRTSGSGEGFWMCCCNSNYVKQ